MIVFHGSTISVPSPDVAHSKRFLDFGRGFYVTSFREQAERWARRKHLRLATGVTEAPILNEYELTDSINDFNVMRFTSVGEEWFDFVCACRDGEDPSPNSDAIIGRVADDDVFKTIQKYRQGRMSKQDAIQELRFAKPNDQIAFRNNEIINGCLRFIRSYQLEIQGVT